ncbi:MAG: polymer-forming cytoskeletal protein [Spirochaetaceae bacterium]|nr:polymer-forming cytoskeletal protein [Spirochaetaceae bacterium]
MPEIHAKRIDEQHVDTILEDDVAFWGEATLTKNMILKGKFYGSINSDDDLYINKTAEVEANITSLGSVFVHGKVKGDIDALKRVELITDCTVDGNIVTDRFVIESNCEFNGACKMRKNV